MIYFLKGRIEEVGADFVALDVNGVGYQAFCSSRTLGSLEVGTAVKLSIYTHVREQEFTLFGFADNSEKQTFELLTTVNGVGAKVGLAILSVMSADEIMNALTMQDGKMFTRAAGVGPKLGERIVMELKNKVGSLPVSVSGGTSAGGNVSVPAGSLANDVISALSNMGYNPADARTALASAMKEHPEGDFNVLFKAGLQVLR